MHFFLVLISQFTKTKKHLKKEGKSNNYKLLIN